MLKLLPCQQNFLKNIFRSKPHPSVASAHDSFWNLKIKHQSHDLGNDTIDRHFSTRSINGTNKNFMSCVKVKIPKRVQKTELTSRVDSSQLGRPESIDSIKIFAEASTLTECKLQKQTSRNASGI